MNKNPYHSFIKDIDSEQVKGELNEYRSGGHYIFKHNINNGIHPAFYDADVLYTEPAWGYHYNQFKSVAGVEDKDDTTHREYLINIERLIKELDIPSYVVMGKHMLGVLSPVHIQEITIHEYPCFLGIWNDTDIPDAYSYRIRNIYDAIQYVCKMYHTVLDPCCGYGNTLRGAIDNNKKAICSDVNGKCIYYMAHNILGKGK